MDCLLRRRPLVACPGRLRLILQSGLDECACGPCRDRRLFAGGESAQVLQDDQCLPSDDHRKGGYQALEAGVLVHIITDRGLTEFGGTPTRTCLAVGPDYDDRIDPVTGDLELY